MREVVTSVRRLCPPDTLQHSICGEDADDHLPGDGADDLQRLSLDCGGLGFTRVWEVRGRKRRASRKSSLSDSWKVAFNPTGITTTETSAATTWRPCGWSLLPSCLLVTETWCLTPTAAAASASSLGSWWDLFDLFSPHDQIQILTPRISLRDPHREPAAPFWWWRWSPGSWSWPEQRSTFTTSWWTPTSPRGYFILSLMPLMHFCFCNKHNRIQNKSTS